MDQPILAEQPRWHVPRHVRMERDGVVVMLDPEAPNWIATDARGAAILSWLEGAASLDDVAARYAAAFGLDGAKSRRHVDRLVGEARRRGFAATAVAERPRYEGRAAHLSPRLDELWVHTNNSCNLACEHCLVGSGPEGDRGLDTERLAALVDEAAALGVGRFYFTGGEPFYREGIFNLVERVTRRHDRELRVLTNGLLFHGAVRERLLAQDRERLRLQVSLDGAAPGTNDPVRGAGTHPRIVAGIRMLVEAGFATTVSTVITRENVGEMTDMVRLVGELGAQAWHLIWIHKKGRWADQGGTFVPPARLLEELRKAEAEAAHRGVTIDNIESYRRRVNGAAGTKVDLSNAGVSSLCVYSDGRVYPSAATVQYPGLELGRWTGGNLAELLHGSETARRLRSLTVVEKPVCRSCELRFLCGGGDLEHSYSYGRAGAGPAGPFDLLDPYCELYKGLIADRMFGLAEEGRRAHRAGTGYDAPVLFHAMGERSLDCVPGGDPEAHAPVRTSHSNCVLSMDVERPRALMRDFYAKAAEAPQPDLCCPVGYEAADTAHIPQEVLDRFYGCGGPMSLAAVQAGETVVDLGSGAGIDVFIAARKVGPAGKAIGVDMTDPMLGVAGRSREAVARNLGFDVAEFRKGYLEDVPVGDASVDLVTSNCVINLSPDKRAVFREMWRILKDHGRIVVSDIVADRALPAGLRVNVHLWGECVSGALPEEEFVAELERAGFFGITVLKKQFWKEVEGCFFHSVTVRGYKFHKTEGCVFKGHRAVYLGPYTSVADEEGHLFPRGEAVEICTDTLAKLGRDPYRGAFALLEPGADAADCAADCGPGCC